MAKTNTIQYDVFGNEINLENKERIDYLNTQISNYKKKIASAYEKIGSYELTIKRLEEIRDFLNKKGK